MKSKNTITIKEIYELRRKLEENERKPKLCFQWKWPFIYWAYVIDILDLYSGTTIDYYIRKNLKGGE